MKSSLRSPSVSLEAFLHFSESGICFAAKYQGRLASSRF